MVGDIASLTYFLIFFYNFSLDLNGHVDEHVVQNVARMYCHDQFPYLAALAP